MPDIQDPGPGRKLQRRYRLIGTTPAPFLSPELVPVVIIDDLSEEEPTTSFAWSSQSVAGVAATQSQTRITNPVDSGILLENLRLQITVFSDSNIRVDETSTGSLASSASTLWADQRRAGIPVALVSRGVDVTVGGGPRIFEARVLGLTLIDIDLSQAVVPEGRMLHFRSLTVNQEVIFSWYWSERRIE